MIAVSTASAKSLLPLAPPELINQLSIIFDILLGESQIIEQVTNGEYWARVAATLRWTDPMANMHVDK